MTEKSSLIQIDRASLEYLAGEEYSDACLILALILDSEGKSGESASSNPVRLLEVAARKGSTWAMYLLARLFSMSRKNAEQAVKWTEAACKHDLTPAKYLKAQFLESGFGYSKDLSKAEKLYIECAKEGLIQASAYLSHAYSNGVFGKKDFSLAADYARIAAKHGDTIAAKYLSDCYFKGIGVPQDTTAAVELLEFAATHGDALASSRLAAIFADGIDGVPVNQAKSKYYLELAKEVVSNQKANSKRKKQH